MGEDGDGDEGRLQLENDSVLSYNIRRAGQLISCWKRQRAAPTQPTTLLVPAQGPLHDTLLPLINSLSSSCETRKALRHLLLIFPGRHGLR